MTKGLIDKIGGLFGARSPRAKPGSKLIIGLGNIGDRYVGSRHNLGFECIDRLADQSSTTVSQRHRHTLVGEGVIGGVAVALVKPRTYVNESGKAVTSLLTRYNASANDLLTIYDDMDLPAGKLRLRTGGGPGGHNGVKSIIEALGTEDFARIRIGIGRPPPDMSDVDYVLAKMTPEERDRADDALERATAAVVFSLTESFDQAMNRFN